MKDRLLSFVDGLREAGLGITVAEALDAMHVVGVTGVELEAFREGLAAALVKDEADRPAFDAVFERFFAAPGRGRGRGERPRLSDEGQGRGSRRAQSAPAFSEQRRHKEEPTPPRPAQFGTERRKREHGEERGRKLARVRALLNLPFEQMSPPDVEACEALMAELAQRFRAHLSRRRCASRRGTVDIRRTLRRSISTGGVPIDPAFRHRRPGQPDLVAFCDLSHSVATASKFLLALLTPASAYFRRVRLFGYVDRAVEVSVEAGMVVPHDQLDLYARSDFGKVLVGFCQVFGPLLTRNTLVLILGDARNNRRPPRADLLGRIRGAVRQVIWLNPESAVRWNTGDSAMAVYQRHCDAVLAASNVRELYAALQRVFRAAVR
ncbi:MAG: VWA domain-containing protein [Candidatus Binatia bacterium]